MIHHLFLADAMNTEQVSSVKDAPYHIVFGQLPRVAAPDDMDANELERPPTPATLHTEKAACAVPPDPFPTEIFTEELATTSIEATTPLPLSSPFSLSPPSLPSTHLTHTSILY